MTTKAESRGKPILFQAWSVQRIRALGKTRTSRVIKPQPEAEVGAYGTNLIWKGDNWGDSLSDACPYGLIGDSLWVRESFWHRTFTPGADDVEGSGQIPPGGEMYLYCATDDPPAGIYADLYTKRPSIHMPRVASRIDLVLEDVRVERLKDITMLDLAAEGIEMPTPLVGDLPSQSMAEDWQRAIMRADMRSEFMRIWDDINAKPRPVKRSGEVVGWISYPWSISTFLGRYGDKVLPFREGQWLYRPGRLKSPVVEGEFLPLVIHDNPWVWVLEFRREEGQ